MSDFKQDESVEDLYKQSPEEVHGPEAEEPVVDKEPASLPGPNGPYPNPRKWWDGEVQDDVSNRLG